MSERDHISARRAAASTCNEPGMCGTPVVRDDDYDESSKAHWGLIPVVRRIFFCTWMVLLCAVYIGVMLTLKLVIGTALLVESCKKRITTR